MELYVYISFRVLFFSVFRKKDRRVDEKKDVWGDHFL